MSTEFFNRQWRLPNDENKDKQSNYSMDFDSASSDYIDAGNPTELQITGDITVSAWFKSTYNNTPTVMQVCKGYYGNGTISWQLYLRGAGSGVGFDYYGGNTVATRVYAQYTVAQNDGQWHHLVGVKSGSSSILYLDGVQVATGVGTQASIYNSSENVTIGASSNNASNFDGQIDGVSIFDYALSSGQVTTLHGSSSTGIGNPMSLSLKPVAYYPLGDQDAFNGADYLVPNSSLKDYVFNFNNNADRITIPTITIASSATISIWVNIRAFSSATQQAFFGDQNTTKLVVNDQSGFVRVIYSDASGLGLLTTNLVTSDFINKWHHIALVQNSGAGTVYIDNINKGNISGALRTPNFTQIGAISAGGLPLNGLISNAALFNTPLPATGTESVASLYNNGTPPDLSSYSNLERWYKLNAADTFNGSTSNWTIKDYAGSNDGTSGNMTSANLVQSNLIFSNGYSPYALDFDAASSDYIDCGNNSSLSPSSFTFSLWSKSDLSNAGWLTKYASENYGFGISGSDIFLNIKTSAGWGGLSVSKSSYLTTNTWHHVVGTYDETDLKIYIDGNLIGSLAKAGPITYSSRNTRMATLEGSSYTGFDFNGQLSNASIWNTALTSAQVKELYNEDVPSNLNNHSAYSNLISWWQLGSNSSFNSSLNQWTCIDEKGTNTGVSSQTFNENAIVDGVSSYANGLSSGMGGNEVVGDAPYSEANSLSVNIDASDRVNDVPS